MLEAFALAHSEIIRICDAIDELAREVGKPKLDRRRAERELEARHGDAVARRIAEVGLKDAASVVDELLAEAAPHDHDGLDRERHRARAAGAQRPADAARDASDSPRSRAPFARSSRASCRR